MTDKPRIRQTADGAMVPSFDGMQNLVSGLGTQADKRSHNRFQFSGAYFNFAELEAAYSENWIARQIVDVPVKDALREWREFQTEDAADIRKEEQRLNLAANFSHGQSWARLYGGSVILMVTDQPLDQPLDVKRIKKGGLHRLVVLDRWEIAPQATNYFDPVAEDYLMPRFYAVRGGTAQQIHHSHLIRIEGAELPRRLRALNESWGDSRLRQVMEDLRDVTSTKGGIAAMVQESNVDVIQRDGLSQELASGEENNIMKRYALAGQMKSMVNQLLLDGTEEYQRKELSFSGLEGVLDKLMVWMSGAADIPMTRLFGQSAAGMNATGEGDLTNYYDSLAGERENKYRPELEKLDQVLVRSALGDYPEDCEWVWNPLYQESGAEKAQQELAYAQSEDMRIQQGVLKPSQVALRLKSQGHYAIEDADIEQMQADEQAEANGEFDPYGGYEDPSDPANPLAAGTADSDFNESQVKRDKEGKFSETGGGSGGSSYKPVSGSIYSDLANREDEGGKEAVKERAMEIAKNEPDKIDRVFNEYNDLGYNRNELEEEIGSQNGEESEESGEANGEEEFDPKWGNLGSPDNYKSGSEKWAVAHYQNNSIPDGWLVHGRATGDTLEGSTPQLSEDWGVAEQYSGESGSKWMIKIDDKDKTMDLSSLNNEDMEKVVKKAIKDYREENDSKFIDDVYGALGDDATDDEIEDLVHDSFAPDDIVDSAKAYDNPDWIEWFANSFSGTYGVKTPDGGIVFEPDEFESIRVDHEDMGH